VTNRVFKASSFRTIRAKDVLLAAAAYVGYLYLKRTVAKAKDDLDAGIGQSNRHHAAMDKEPYYEDHH
jgi:hypothetical protein